MLDISMLSRSVRPLVVKSSDNKTGRLHTSCNLKAALAALSQLNNESPSRLLELLLLPFVADCKKSR